MMVADIETIRLSPSLPIVRCPPGVRVAAKSSSELNADVLLPEETKAANNFSEKRLTEYTLGRACAREILSTLGYADFPVRIGEARQPLWPKGLVGSISHAGDTAICAIAPARKITGIGIDIETITEETFDLLELVQSDDEHTALLALSNDCHYLAKLLFSAKESVFKCQFPLTGNWLEFKDVTLVLDIVNRIFSTKIQNQARTITITGTWDVSDRLILSMAWLA